MYEVIFCVHAGHLSVRSFLGNMKKQSLHIKCWHGFNRISYIEFVTSSTTAYFVSVIEPAPPPLYDVNWP